MDGGWRAEVGEWRVEGAAGAAAAADAEMGMKRIRSGRPWPGIRAKMAYETEC